jgi:hypothetical protein
VRRLVGCDFVELRRRRIFCVFMEPIVALHVDGQVRPRLPSVHKVRRADLRCGFCYDVSPGYRV